MVETVLLIFTWIYLRIIRPGEKIMSYYDVLKPKLHSQIKQRQNALATDPPNVLKDLPKTNKVDVSISSVTPRPNNYFESLSTYPDGDKAEIFHSAFELCLLVDN